MTLQRQVFEVALNTPDGIAVHQVAIGSGDKMRAEREAARHKIKLSDGPYTCTQVQLWAALTREGLVKVGYQEFSNEVLEEFDTADDANGKPVVLTVDPTQPATGAGSHSSSPATSAEDPPTGSTPTSTSGS